MRLTKMMHMSLGRVSNAYRFGMGRSLGTPLQRIDVPWRTAGRDSLLVVNRRAPALHDSVAYFLLNESLRGPVASKFCRTSAKAQFSACDQSSSLPRLAMSKSQESRSSGYMSSSQSGAERLRGICDLSCREDSGTRIPNCMNCDMCVLVKPNVRGEAGPTARRQARRKDDKRASPGAGPGGLPLGLASTEGLGLHWWRRASLAALGQLRSLALQRLTAHLFAHLDSLCGSQTKASDCCRSTGVRRWPWRRLWQLAQCYNLMPSGDSLRSPAVELACDAS